METNSFFDLPQTPYMTKETIYEGNHLLREIDDLKENIKNLELAGAKDFAEIQLSFHGKALNNSIPFNCIKRVCDIVLEETRVQLFIVEQKLYNLK